MHDEPVSPRVKAAWDRHIQRAQPTPEGPSVQTLLALAEEQGDPSQDDVLRHLAARCEPEEVQQAWADWTAVTDREELRFRLEVLRQMDTLDPSLTSFVLFFFRASDPVLYQTAARVVGRHLKTRPEFHDYLQAFADEHSVRLDAPIPLNGERSHRRLLIAQAARRAHGAADTPVLETDDPEMYLTASALDLNAALGATRILLEGEAPLSKEKTFASGVARWPRALRGCARPKEQGSGHGVSEGVWRSRADKAGRGLEWCRLGNKKNPRIRVAVLLPRS